MKGLITTIRNIFRIEELRSRILYTLGLILVYRLGAHIVLPGIDTTQLKGFQDQASEGILGLIDIFAGGAFSQASIFALGIMPYISASIVVQLLTIAVPYFQKMQKEGESGRKKMNQITRWLTVLVTLGQAPGYLVNLNAMAPGAIVMEGATFWITSILILMAGTLFVMWIGERITEHGIGNGISIIIM
ncbi:MAG: preprotein translocase subunit SecY, partial [Bacteroidota bacterium]